MKKVGAFLFPLITILFIVTVCILFSLRKSSNGTIIPDSAIPSTQAHTGHLIDNSKLNINKATAEELAHLPGIGETLAERIVAYRKSNGHFSGPQDLLQVKGITETILETILPYIAVA